MKDEAADKAADVKAEDGNVCVEGPGGIRYSFTPDAAVETSDRLFRGGAEAAGQRAQEAIRRRKPKLS